ncbi:MAG TPA: hypothetical protein VJM13_14685 [Sphingopyxis sp.]|nr:hypothetical protein [Sphingopyxis sp.]
MISGLLLAISTLTLAQPQPSADPGCTDDRGVDRCAEAEQRRMRDLYGVRTIEEHRAAGDQVRRIFYVDGYGRDLVLISFVRAPGDDPTLWVHYPREEGQRPAPQQTVVSGEAFEEAIDRSRTFHRSFVPLDRSDPEFVVVCLHGWVYAIEANDPAIPGVGAGRLRRKTESACADGPGAIYARDLQRLALAQLPHCATLEPEYHRNAASILYACRVLGGDRLAAARALNAAEPLLRFSSGEDPGALAGVFDERSTIVWDGVRNEGQGSAAAFWVRKLEENARPNFQVESVHGESAARMRMTGFLYRYVGPEDAQRIETAPVELSWVGPGDEPRVAQASVGAFAPRAGQGRE